MVEGTIGVVLRLTARISAGLLCAAFFAYAAQFSRSLVLRWYSRKRRWFLGLLAVSHTAHLAAIFEFWHMNGLPPAPALIFVTIFGGAAFLFIYAAAVDGMGVRFSPRLISFGLYYAWTAFFVAITSRALHSVLHGVLSAILLTALISKIAAGRMQVASAARAIAT